MAQPLLLGHRGCRVRRHPFTPVFPHENTIAAFDLCLEAGCNGFEFDVRATSDQRLVVCHDPSHRGRVLAECSYERLARDCGEVCCLEEVLQRYQKTAFLDIELKVAGMEEQVADLVETFTPERGFVISSFLPEVIERLHGIAGSLPLGFIFNSAESEHLWRRLPVTHVMPQFKLASEELIRELHEEEKFVIPWTVNRLGDMERLAGWGADGVISDDPRELCRVFRGRGSRS